MKFLISLATILSLSTVQSAEVDSFNNRLYPITDSLSIINKETNAQLNEAIMDLNASSAGCSEKKLYKRLRKSFNNQYLGELPRFIIKSDSVDKIITPVEHSIYKDFKWYETLIQGFTARVFSDPSGDLLKVNGFYIGTDKFEHFLGSGYLYFKKHYLKKKPITESLKIGWMAETSILGAWTTGVISHADMSANFNGMRFYNHILQKNQDILGQNLGPYLSCVNDKWIQVREINWANYIDESFDEAINCSRFRNKRLLKKVKNRLSEYKDQLDGYDFCRANTPKLLELYDKYFPYSYITINKDGMGTLDKKTKDWNAIESFILDNH